MMGQTTFTIYRFAGGIQARRVHVYADGNGGEFGIGYDSDLDDRGKVVGKGWFEVESQPLNSGPVIHKRGS